MAIITKIVEQKNRPNRRSIFLDGAFAFGVHENVVAKFRLRVGMELSPERVAEIGEGEVRQECFDEATRILRRRLHSRAELRGKLMKGEFGEGIVSGVLDQLQELGYVNDERFAQTKALSAAEHKHHGRRRAMAELRKAGVSGEVASRALDQVYDSADSVAVARELAMKYAGRLRKLDPQVARRRLVGMLQRRGFEYEAIKPVIEAVLGRGTEGEI
jgi:regulatory protein